MSTHHDCEHGKAYWQDCNECKTAQVSNSAVMPGSVNYDELLAAIDDLFELDIRWLNHCDTGTVIQRMHLSIALDKIKKAAGK